MNNFYDNNQWGIKLLNAKKILIFGAKKRAKEIYRNWQEKTKIVGFLVSKREDNPYVIEGKPVYVFEDIPPEEKSAYAIVISQQYDNTEELKKILHEAGFAIYFTHGQFIGYGSYLYKEDLWCKKMVKLPESKKDTDWELIKKLRIYAVTSHRNFHKEKMTISSAFIEPIQGGAALTDIKIAEVRDDSGINVSHENPQLCEMSAAYWIGNNDKEHSYVGICHYCRLFDISDKQVMAIFEENYDVIVPLPNIYCEQMLEIADPYIHKAIERVFPEDDPFAEKYLSGHVFFWGNIMIAKRQIYKEYVDWVFKILDGIKEVFREEGADMFPRRLAYVSEHLTNIWILKNMESFKFAYAKVRVCI